MFCILGVVAVADQFKYSLETRGPKHDLGDIIGLVDEAILRAAARAGTEEGEAIMAASKEIVPVDTGVLRASADAVGINVIPNGDGVEIAFGYGGAASHYSIVQHETPHVGPGEPKGPFIGYEHREPTTWKFLERPVMEATEGFESRIASRIRQLVKGEIDGAA